MPKLTKRLVESLAPKAKDYIVWDDELPGFGIRVWPSGKRVYILKYRTENGRQRKPRLGPHGPLTADDARRRARLWLGEAAGGNDPSGERSEARRAPTLAEFAERYMQEHAQAKKKPLSVREDRRLLDRVILPELGSRKLGEIEREDIARLHHNLHKTPYQANRALALLSRMFNLAEAWRLRPDHSNPCRHVTKFKEKRRERWLTEEELARLGAVLSECEAAQSETMSALHAVSLLILTGARVSEILALKWSHIDWEQRCVRLPDSKTGAKTIFLSAPAIETLTSIPRTEGNDHVIVGGRTGAALVDLEKPWQRIRVKAGLDDVRLHDLRHSFASHAVRKGWSLPMIGGLLGHRETATTARYAHLAVAPLRQANDAIGEGIAAALHGAPRPTP